MPLLFSSLHIQTQLLAIHLLCAILKCLEVRNESKIRTAVTG